MRFVSTTALCLFIACCGCGFRRVGVYRIGEPDQRGADKQSREMEKEEQEMEDPDALAAIIEEKLAKEGEKKAPSGAKERIRTRLAEDVYVPTAEENWKLSSEQCLEMLKTAGVKTKVPTFETPLVFSPLMLDGSIDGVEIRPRWPRSDPVNEVIDCHLALALVAVARKAKEIGVNRVLFYSAYRPIRPVSSRCEKTEDDAQCKKERAAYEQASKRLGKSQHRRALAIDIGWLVTDDGRTIDVSKNFDRRAGENPCGYDADSDDAELLLEFACALHAEKIFNVMLTPNADKAHWNHFHFDITPEARWYIVR